MLSSSFRMLVLFLRVCLCMLCILICVDSSFRDHSFNNYVKLGEGGRGHVEGDILWQEGRGGVTSRRTYAPAELYLLYTIPSLRSSDFYAEHLFCCLLWISMTIRKLRTSSQLWLQQNIILSADWRTELADLPDLQSTRPTANSPQ